jgi:hypothetical protein
MGKPSFEAASDMNLLINTLFVVLRMNSSRSTLQHYLDKTPF